MEGGAGPRGRWRAADAAHPGATAPAGIAWMAATKSIRTSARDAADAARRGGGRWSLLAHAGEGHAGPRAGGVVRACAGGAARLSAMRNLLDNAVRASPEDAGVDLRIVSSDGQSVSEVLDRGPGLSEEDRAMATRRFWRRSQGGRRQRPRHWPSWTPLRSAPRRQLQSRSRAWKAVCRRGWNFQQQPDRVHSGRCKTQVGGGVTIGSVRADACTKDPHLRCAAFPSMTSTHVRHRFRQRSPRVPPLPPQRRHHRRAGAGGRGSLDS